MVVQANGTSASGTNVSIDGVSATNSWVQFYSTAVPSTDAIETVNVVTASSGADQGAVNGAGIRVQIKSGTNSFHGTAYEYNENNTLKAKPYFQPSGDPKQKYIDNDSGGTIGGPIIKDKLFFFGSYEGDRLRQAAGAFYTCRLPRWRRASCPHRLRFTIQPLEILMAAAERRFPKTRMATTSFPLPALFDFAKPSDQRSFGCAQRCVFQQHLHQHALSYNLQKIDTKVDWETTTKLRLTGRFSDYPYSQTQAPAFGNVLGGGGYNTNQMAISTRSQARGPMLPARNW